jgi:hypothetical protein
MAIETDSAAIQRSSNVASKGVRIKTYGEMVKMLANLLLTTAPKTAHLSATRSRKNVRNYEIIDI